MPLDDEVRALVRVRSGSDRVASREAARLEFKETFSFGSIALYLRTLAAFANTQGGFIVFGVTDSPRQLVGVDRERFDSLDPARFTTHANTYFSPAIQWSMGDVEIGGKTLGYLHAAEHHAKPIVCKADAGSDLREGDIYFRYRGQTTRIKYPELAEIFHDRLERERAAWREHIERIASAGPTNVGVVDTVAGRLYGGGTTFLLDDRLIERLKFIQEGSFDEVDGDPTLRLVGDVQPIGVVAPARATPVAVHYHEIISAFLADRNLVPVDAAVFFREACREDSIYVPLHFFVRKAGWTKEQALSELRSLRGIPRNHRDNLKRRIGGTHRVLPVGSVEHPLPRALPRNTGDFKEAVRTADAPKDTRSLLVAALAERPALVLENLDSMEPARVSEAVTNLSAEVIRQRQSSLREILSGLYLSGFEAWDGSVRTTFRKAVSHLDECMYL